MNLPFLPSYGGLRNEPSLPSFIWGVGLRNEPSLPSFPPSFWAVPSVPNMICDNSLKSAFPAHFPSTAPIHIADSNDMCPWRTMTWFLVTVMFAGCATHQPLLHSDAPRHERAKPALGFEVAVTDSYEPTSLDELI